MDNLSIDFYDETHAAVSIAWPEGTLQATDTTGAGFAEMLLFACFAIRQLRNLGNHPSARSLAHELGSWRPLTLAAATQHPEAMPGQTVTLNSHVLYSAAVELGIDLHKAARKYGQPIFLVPYHGKGKKRFVGRLGLGGERPVFLLSFKGFGLGGLLGIGTPLYAPDSVLHVLCHLRNLHYSDDRYIKALVNVAEDCATAYQESKITALNQESLALQSVKRHIPQGPGSKV